MTHGKPVETETLYSECCKSGNVDCCNLSKSGTWWFILNILGIVFSFGATLSAIYYEFNRCCSCMEGIFDSKMIWGTACLIGGFLPLVANALWFSENSLFNPDRDGDFILRVSCWLTILAGMGTTLLTGCFCKVYNAPEEEDIYEQRSRGYQQPTHHVPLETTI